MHFVDIHTVEESYPSARHEGRYSANHS